MSINFLSDDGFSVGLFREVELVECRIIAPPHLEDYHRFIGVRIEDDGAGIHAFKRHRGEDGARVRRVLVFGIKTHILDESLGVNGAVTRRLARERLHLDDNRAIGFFITLSIVMVTGVLRLEGRAGARRENYSGRDGYVGACALRRRDFGPGIAGGLRSRGYRYGWRFRCTVL